MKIILLLCCVLITAGGCSAQNYNSQATTRAISFPGAEGFGKFTTGGRGGKTLIVSNLNDSGEGSLRWAATQKYPRTIVFTVSGTIHLETPLKISKDVTIAGQSAPGDGICVADQPVTLIGDNVIVRYMRFRLGDKYQRGGMNDGNGSDDAFGATRRSNIIVDHCSVSWSTDEAFSFYGGDSTTLQYNLISEPLNYSYHFEKGDKDFERHGYGAIMGGKHLTVYGNLFAHCNSRTPRFDGIRNIPEENVDYVNNIIYNWGTNNVYAGEGGNYNIVNNYYKYGPETKTSVKSRIVNPYKAEGKIPFGKFYVNGNYVDGDEDVTDNNWLGVHMEKGTLQDKGNAKLNSPLSTVTVSYSSAEQAYENSLKNVGASFSRDTLDKRIINDVMNRTGRLIDVQGGFKHGTDYDLTINAWPKLTTSAPPLDSDLDGMPDKWETQHKLDPRNPEDGQLFTLDKKYTNIEMYLNGLISKM